MVFVFRVFVVVCVRCNFRPRSVGEEWIRRTTRNAATHQIHDRNGHSNRWEDTGWHKQYYLDQLLEHKRAWLQFLFLLCESTFIWPWLFKALIFVDIADDPCLLTYAFNQAMEASRSRWEFSGPRFTVIGFGCSFTQLYLVRRYFFDVYKTWKFAKYRWNCMSAPELACCYQCWHRVDTVSHTCTLRTVVVFVFFI